MDIILTDSPDTITLSPGELQPGFSLFALREADVITGSSSNEVMFGGKDNDQLFLEGGNDEANGNNERDLVVGGAGNDTLRGGKDGDVVVGGLGNDIIYGDRGADGMVGNEGADTFVLLADDDTASGPDQLLDFNAAEGDRLALLGNLSPEDLVIVEIPPESIVRDTFSSIFLPGLSLQELIQATQISSSLFESAPPGLASYDILTPSGEAIAQIFLTTEADIRNSFVEL